jgi:hypothetical protein
MVGWVVGQYLDDETGLVGVGAVEVVDVAVEAHAHEVVLVPQAAELLVVHAVAAERQIERAARRTSTNRFER